MEMKCPQCSSTFDANTSRVNRATKLGSPLFCGKTCAGLARRNPHPLTKDEKRRSKAEYDREYRSKNLASIKAKKAAYYQRTRDPEKERVKRKENMAKHVAYCRTDEYRAKKKAYDADRRFKAYGPFEEVARLLDQVEQEINKQASRYEIYKAKGYFTRSAIQRRRELWQTINRN